MTRQTSHVGEDNLRIAFERVGTIRALQDRLKIAVARGYKREVTEIEEEINLIVHKLQEQLKTMCA